MPVNTASVNKSTIPTPHLNKENSDLFVLYFVAFGQVNENRHDWAYFVPLL